MGTVIMEKENTQQIYSVEANSYDCIGCAIAKGELNPPGGTIYESRNISIFLGERFVRSKRKEFRQKRVV